jgi:hypothetical protein
MLESMVPNLNYPKLQHTKRHWVRVRGRPSGDVCPHGNEAAELASASRHRRELEARVSMLEHDVLGLEEAAREIIDAFASPGRFVEHLNGHADSDRAQIMQTCFRRGRRRKEIGNDAKRSSPKARLS